jgi:hypothetical protein
VNGPETQVEPSGVFVSADVPVITAQPASASVNNMRGQVMK